MPPRFARLSVLAFTILLFTTFMLLIAPAASHAAPPAKTGDLWQVTSRVTMEGMPMELPAQTQSVCTPKTWTEPPGARNPQQDCTISDVRSTGARMTWKMSCTSPTMTGEGEITRTGPDAYSGVIRMTGDEGSMTMNLSGKRSGECDYQDTGMTSARSAAAAQKLDADLQKIQADACKGLAQSLQLQMLKTPGMGCEDDATREIFCDTAFSAEGMKSLIGQGNGTSQDWTDALEFCADASGKPAYCAQFNTPSGFSQFASYGTGPGSAQETIATFCGLSAAQVEDDRQALCRAAADGTSELVFLARFCPVEAGPIAERECAGRSFTSMGASPYAEFCASYATTRMDQTAQAPGTPPEETKGKKTKNFFKKVLSR